MTRKIKALRALVGFGALLVLLVAGYLVIRPWHLRWGATAAEAARTMGDVPSGQGWTRAITINAPPERIWPWLVQWGQGRGGWYSYDWLENLLGFDIHSADQILPAYQNLAVGDPICMARGMCVSKVTILQANQLLSWQTADPAGQPIWTFTLGLFPEDSTHTRLVVRETFGSAIPTVGLVALEIPDVVMEQKMLDTLKNRAEGRASSAAVTGVEISAWLAALALGLSGSVLFVRRRNWQNPFLLGAAAVLALLILTFLFPPLWLRALLDLALLAGLVFAAADKSFSWSLWAKPSLIDPGPMTPNPRQ